MGYVASCTKERFRMYLLAYCTLGKYLMLVAGNICSFYLWYGFS